jgi:uncharacterized protein
MNKIVKITALKYQNILHYEWEGELLLHNPEFLLVLCKPGRKLIHHTKNKVFTIDNTSLEYFSLKEMFTAAIEVKDGKVISTYCNIAMPSTFTDGEIRFIDLDLDYIKEKDNKWTLVDEDEFEVNSIKYGYPHELKKQTIIAVKRLKAEVRQGIFPFNNEILSVLSK